MNDSEPANLEQLLDRLESAEQGDDGHVTVGRLLDALGRRSFGPLLLLAGLIVASPLSGIPGVPTLTALIVLLIAGQLLLRRKSFWLPEWLLRRRFAQSRFDRTLRTLRPAARSVDKLVRPRLVRLTQGPFVYLIGAVSLLLALSMPPLELIPFASSAVGTVLAAFGLALIARDGAFVIAGLVICAAAVVWVSNTAL